MNKILKYTSKDYNSILNDLKEAIPSLTDLWTNTNDGDPGIVLVKLMSALGDMLSYNLDKQALEYYSPTVTQRKNAAKLFNLIGYKMHWYQSALDRMSVTNITPPTEDCNVVIKWNIFEESGEDASGPAYQAFSDACDVFFTLHPYNEANAIYYVDANTRKTNGDLVAVLMPTYDSWRNDNAINLYTYIAYPNNNLTLYGNSDSTIPYLIIPSTSAETSPDDTTILPNYSILPGDTIELDIIQGSLNRTPFNNTKLRNNRFYLIETAVDEEHIWVSYETSQSGAITSKGFISKVDNLLTVTDDKIHFEFNVDEYDRPYIEFSSYWKDKLGDSVTFTIYYIRTNGVFGNITTDYITSISGVPNYKYKITHPANTNTVINNDGVMIAIPGKHPELPHEAYINSLNWVTTFNTLVTIYDFERFCKRQSGITNAFAVDKQRSIDLNNEIATTAASYTEAQLQAFKSLTTDSNPNLVEMYINHKTVICDDSEIGTNYVPYAVQLLVVFGNFALTMEGASTPIATMQIYNPTETPNKGYWLYKLVDTYTPDNNANYNTIEDAGNVVKYLDNKFREIKVANVVPQYSAIRVFPWRCCGTIHLTAPVSRVVGDQIIQSVISHLKSTFSPYNLKFGETINYMDVINVVMNAHSMIRYFDAGLGNRKLIDIDEDIDFSYFNPTSLMYYIQELNDSEIAITDGSITTNKKLPGNNSQYLPNTTINNPYYKLLSIAPEYILD